MHADPAADDSELGSQPADAPSDQQGEEEDMSDMALEDAIMAAHHGMAGEAADDLAPDLVDASAADDGEHYSSQHGGQQFAHASRSADRPGLSMGDFAGLAQSAAHEQAKVSEMTFLAQLRPAGNAEISPVGSEDGELHLSTPDGTSGLTAPASPAADEVEHSSSSAAGASLNAALHQSKPGQDDAEEMPDEAVRIAAWQAYWQSQYEAGAYQPPPQGPPGLPLSSLSSGSGLQAASVSNVAALPKDYDPATSPALDTASLSHGMDGFQHTAGGLGPSQEPRRLQDDLPSGSAAEAAASSSPQNAVKEGQPGLQSPGLSAWQPWLEWWQGIAGNEPAIGDYTTAEVNPLGTALETSAADQAAPSAASRLSLQPGQATQHVGDEDLIAVPISLLRRYQQLEWEEWLRRWQAWQAQQVQPADKTSGNL